MTIIVYLVGDNVGFVLSKSGDSLTGGMRQALLYSHGGRALIFAFWRQLKWHGGLYQWNINIANIIAICDRIRMFIVAF